MADKKISELDQVLQINNDAVIPISQKSGGTPTTYKAQITQIGAEIGEDQTFSNLQTTDKTLVGAINEVAQGGGGGGSSNANIAPDYDATSTYAVGDWCIYNGTLYQCNTAIPTAEAFDPTHWTAKKVVDAFADIEDELDGKVDTTDFYATNLPIESGSATNTKDYIDKIAPQLYRVVGTILNSNGGTIKGAGTAMITLANGIARIDFALMIDVADTVSHNDWGINRDFFTAIVGKTITPSFGGVFTYFTDAGIIYSDRQGYGGAFSNVGQFWKPARIYRSSTNPDAYSTGDWADTLFPVGTRMVGTCWGTYT